MFRFEKLDAWKYAIDLADLVYKTTRNFPTEERFGLTNQIRRSAVSVSANVAEGSGRASDRDNARFVEIAYGSLMETVSHAQVAHRQGYFTEEDHASVYSLSDRVARILSGYRNKLLGSAHQNPIQSDTQPPADPLS